jgi:hypothetical protein
MSMPHSRQKLSYLAVIHRGCTFWSRCCGRACSYRRLSPASRADEPADRGGGLGGGGLGLWGLGGGGDWPSLRTMRPPCWRMSLMASSAADRASSSYGEVDSRTKELIFSRMGILSVAMGKHYRLRHQRSGPMRPASQWMKGISLSGSSKPPPSSRPLSESGLRSSRRLLELELLELELLELELDER